MKRFFIAVALALCCAVGAQARDEVVRDVNCLPQPAQSFLSKNFKSDVSFIKIDKTLGYVTDYEVVLTDGAEIDFNRDGSWDSIDMPGSKAVPSSLVPRQISDYVAKNFPKQKIVSINKESHGYDIELQSGLDLEFDKAGQFKRIDD